MSTNNIDYKTISILLLVRFRETIKENLMLGSCTLSDEAGRKAELFEGLLYNIFSRRRNNIPIRIFDDKINIKDFLVIIEDVLEISDMENPGILNRNWDGELFAESQDT